MKQKSIFSFTRPPARTNSVVIEELPSEFSANDKIDANVKTKSNETVANMSKFNEVAINKKMSSRQIKTSDTKNLNKNSEQSMSNLNDKCYKMSPRKVQVADKYKNKTSKSEKYISKVYD